MLIYVKCVRYYNMGQRLFRYHYQAGARYFFTCQKILHYQAAS